MKSVKLIFAGLLLLLLANILQVLIFINPLILAIILPFIYGLVTFIIRSTT